MHMKVKLDRFKENEYDQISFYVCMRFLSFSYFILHFVDGGGFSRQGFSLSLKP